MKKTIKDFKDKNGNQIKIGDTLQVGKNVYGNRDTVTVVKTDDLETGFGFDLEDKDGDRLYNPYFAVEEMELTKSL